MQIDPRERAKWRPIAEFHEELQPVVVIHIDDPGGVSVAWSDDITESELEEDGPRWTHFAELPLLANEMAEAMRKGQNQVTKSEVDSI